MDTWESEGVRHPVWVEPWNRKGTGAAAHIDAAAPPGLYFCGDDFGGLFPRPPPDSFPVVLGRFGGVLLLGITSSRC